MAYQSTITNEADDKSCIDAYLQIQGIIIKPHSVHFALEVFASGEKKLAGKGCIAKLRVDFTPEQQEEVYLLLQTQFAQYIRQNDVPIVRSNTGEAIDFSNSSIIPDVEPEVVEETPII